MTDSTEVTDERIDELANEFGEMLAAEVGDEREFTKALAKAIKILQENLEALQGLL